jgi:hypothetical protein
MPAPARFRVRPSEDGTPLANAMVVLTQSAKRRAWYRPNGHDEAWAGRLQILRTAPGKYNFRLGEIPERLVDGP